MAKVWTFLLPLYNPSLTWLPSLHSTLCSGTRMCDPIHYKHRLVYIIFTLAPFLPIIHCSNLHYFVPAHSLRSSKARAFVPFSHPSPSWYYHSWTFTEAVLSHAPSTLPRSNSNLTSLPQQILLFLAAPRLRRFLLIRSFSFLRFCVCIIILVFFFYSWRARTLTFMRRGFVITIYKTFDCCYEK